MPDALQSVTESAMSTAVLVESGSASKPMPLVMFAQPAGSNVIWGHTASFAAFNGTVKKPVEPLETSSEVTCVTGKP